MAAATSGGNVTSPQPAPDRIQSRSGGVFESNRHIYQPETLVKSYPNTHERARHHDGVPDINHASDPATAVPLPLILQ
ncbi:hypothetical protein GGTG_02960 [Gaeumannomyces tritici R3-111a-1]|uniref:Uncharacterized protein n=1 Tax=Gaeumannomyces tritici (strain R3-111a-1) TaxID=644352 RepID=J3NNV4_GAET3|nr:hypothetical protein GGTG_02960 [Gaeumannomyces tritici R3-111a-1]EJT77857.1 hypothetical protein GGTG_02960 [Gaeumannomyces tritici R3-111a-1]